MSEMAKQARAAMKAKASKLTTADPHQKVDSSTWTPPEPINAEVKTGLRPVSRRAFKTGGKVQGAKAKVNVGRKPRQSGGKALTADSLINRNVKEANEQRPGGKAHVGGYQRGGTPAPMPLPVPRPAYLGSINTPEDQPITPEMAARMRAISDADAAANRRFEDDMIAQEALKARGFKRGGRTEKCWGGKSAKKAMGGPLAGSEKMMQDAQNVAGVPASVLNSAPAQSRFSKQMGLKKGGMAKHPDEKADMALIKKMVKPASLRKGRADGGRDMLDSGEDTAPDSAGKGLYLAVNAAGKSGPRKDRAEAMLREMGERKAHRMAEADQSIYRDRKSGGKARTARKEGGGVFSGPGYPGKVPGVTGGRIARATGGKTKGKTNVNIVIATGKPAGGADMMGPPPGLGKPPGGLPIPVPPAGAAPMGGGMPMPVAAPAPMPAPMPTPRKAGGRLTKVAKSYKDMEAGAGSGEGRLQKTDIAKARAGRKDGGKTGHRTYRSYKDMDAGAGSGFGRLEKTEIQKRKH